jgi:hypothetical protein
MPPTDIKKKDEDVKKPVIQHADRLKQLRQTRDTRNLIKGLAYRTNPKRPTHKSSAFLSTTRGLSTKPFVEEEEPLSREKRSMSINSGNGVGRYNPRFDLVH